APSKMKPEPTLPSLAEPLEDWEGETAVKAPPGSPVQPGRPAPFNPELTVKLDAGDLDGLKNHGGRAPAPPRRGTEPSAGVVAHAIVLLMNVLREHGRRARCRTEARQALGGAASGRSSAEDPLRARGVFNLETIHRQGQTAASRVEETACALGIARQVL